eukprot:jgi/Picsp_1/2753/NSC_00981-R1_protein
MMASDVTAQVGLQLLLKPYSNTMGEIVCGAVGTVYPAYASFKAIEYMRVQGDTDEATRWLMYWAIYSLFSMTERIGKPILNWIPYYAPLKLAFLLWLQLPRFSGAYRLTVTFIRPLLHRYYPLIDDFVRQITHSFSRPEILKITDALQEIMAQIPGVKWFMLGPDGEPWVPPSRRFID